MRNTVSFWPLVLLMSSGAALAQDVRLNAPGAPSELRSALRAASATVSLDQDGGGAPQDFVAAARADYQRLLTGLYSEGYYGGTISILVDGIEAFQLDPLVAPAAVNEIVLRVEPGPQFSFGRTDIGPLAPGTLLPEAFGRGEVARAGVVSDAAGAAVETWNQDGHPLARTAGQTITADHPDQTLNVEILIDPGPELTFGRLTIEGNDAVRTERVRAIAGLPEGVVYDPALIARAEENLRRTGAFSSATIIEGDVALGTTLPLTLSVAEQVPRRIGAGIEYSSVSGLTLSGFWLHRNLLGGGEQFRIDGEITGLSGGTGGIDYSLGATYLRPATLRQDTDLYANALIEQLDEPSFFQRELGIEAGLIRRLGSSDTQVEVGLGFQTGEVEDDQGDRTYSLFYAPIKGTTDRRNDPFDATSGYYATLTIAPFVGIQGTDDGIRVVGDSRIYRSFGEDDRFTLAVRGQIGSVIGADAATLPADYLFYSGGGGTVRGQEYQSLAIDLGNSDTRGGTSFFGAQLEARVGVTDTIGIVGFYDAGYISADENPFTNTEMHAGAGLGLRYDTGIGPIRLDVATPASGDEAGQSIEVYIGIGQSF